MSLQGKPEWRLARCSAECWFGLWLQPNTARLQVGALLGCLIQLARSSAAELGQKRTRDCVLTFFSKMPLPVASTCRQQPVHQAKRIGG